MRYWEPEPRPRDYLERQLQSDDSETVRHTLIEAAYYEDDWRWVQSECSRLSHHQDEGIRYVTVICLSFTSLAFTASLTGSRPRRC